MTDDRTPGTLELIGELAERLDKAGVSYCHWKSNQAIERSLSGENDLDLLIASQSVASFRAVAAEMGLVPARSLHNPRIDGIEDLFGWDRPSNRLVHVQPHFKLVLGDDMTKSFHLPIEDAYLASVRADGVLPIPTPEMEYIVLIVRMTLKHCPLEALIARKGRLTRTERAELDHLEVVVDPAIVESLRSELLPMVEPEIWQLCRRALEPESGIGLRAHAGRALATSLRTMSERPLAADTALKIWRRRTHRQGSPKRPASVGLLVGVVGADGSGKSTVVQRLSDSLSSVFAVEQIHLGKPPRGITRRLAGRILRLGRFETTRDTLRAPSWHEHPSHPGLLFVLWHLLIARDRRREYLRARRLAAQGYIVISDRFPLSSISTMDATRTADLPSAGRIARWMSAREQKIYEQMAGPDLLLVLRVDPDVAAERRSDQASDFVRTRASEVWQAPWDETPAVVIDAGGTPDEVFRAAFSALWSRL